ncbi:hypothetical protein LFLEISCH_03960 [Listeria fleischmannii subsp. fleischmannii LU2006-1]|nr:hypothetical protein LFLEISCH_03960 [Listeria fleischmannii subsp. fleischmannii LU2006-1]
MKQVIETGIRNDNIIEVKKGLKKGERNIITFNVYKF